MGYDSHNDSDHNQHGYSDKCHGCSEGSSHYAEHGYGKTGGGGCLGALAVLIIAPVVIAYSLHVLQVI